MATEHGVAGEWARVNGTVLGLWPLFLSVFAGGFALALAVFGSLAWGVALLVLAILYGTWSLLRGLRHVERFFKGARGEERVANILKILPEGYHVFNDLVAGGHHIDHVVVGPAGVFAVETKFWRGKVTLEGDYILVEGRLPSHPPLRQVRHEAELVKTMLASKGWSGVVTPVLAFASDTFEAKIAEAQGAVILNSNYLRESFLNGKTVLLPAEIDRLVGLMENHS